MLPFINEIKWPYSTGRARPLARQNAESVAKLVRGWRAPEESAWEENPTSIKQARQIWFSGLLLSILGAILYAPVLHALGRQWLDDPNYGHGIFVPIFAVYVLWNKRDRWSVLSVRPNNFGLAVMLFAVGLLVLGTLGADLFTARLSIVVLISGIVLFLAGSPILRSIAFPVGYLVLMIPLPAIVYYQMTFPLQLLASRLGAGGLVALGIHTVREGNLIILPNCTLNVVEACSGIRSLLSLLAAVVAYGYLAESKAWRRCALALSIIPIAIVTNGLRLVATGVLSFFFTPAMDAGVVHMLLGLAFFSMAFLAVVGIHKLLRRYPEQQNRVPVHP